MIGLTIVLPGVLMLALFEELLFRGYALRALELAVGPAVAVVATAALFALAHAAHPHVGWLALGNIFLMGAVLALAIQRTGTLWVAVGLHVGWNFGLYAAGLPVSGQSYPNPWAMAELEPSLLLGSAFGPEDSLAASLLLIGSLVVLALGRAAQTEERSGA